MKANGQTTREAQRPSSRGESESGDIETRHATVLATFAHDLRSPLSSIRTAIEVLKLSLKDPQQTERLIGLLERQTSEIARLLDGLMGSAPATAEQNGPAPASPLETPATLSFPRRVLVVDDSRTTTDILSLFFKMEGFDVSSAYFGADALDLARDLQPDVIFLDLGLPDMSGYEVAAKIREIPGGEQVFLVALTGRDEEDDRKNIANAGFDLHVVKPTEPGMLREVLKKSATKAH